MLNLPASIALQRWQARVGGIQVSIHAHSPTHFCCTWLFNREDLARPGLPPVCCFTPLQVVAGNSGTHTHLPPVATHLPQSDFTCRDHTSCFLHSTPHMLPPTECRHTHTTDFYHFSTSQTNQVAPHRASRCRLSNMRDSCPGILQLHAPYADKLVNSATPLLIQCSAGTAPVGSRISNTKLVLCPVVLNTPRRSAVLYKGQL